MTAYGKREPEPTDQQQVGRPLPMERHGRDKAEDRLTWMVIAATLFGIGHHIDHVIRGNHVGWPISTEFTPFTASLLFYPVILVGLLLYRWNRVRAGFWAVLAGVGFLFVGLLHFGPLAVEPPEDILGPYASPVAGWSALLWLVLFLALLLAVTVHAGRVWLRQWRRRA